jgi:hypothetical protein
MYEFQQLIDLAEKGYSLKRWYILIN